MLLKWYGGPVGASESRLRGNVFCESRLSGILCKADISYIRLNGRFVTEGPQRTLAKNAEKKADEAGPTEAPDWRNREESGKIG